ncbi:MAG: magnesium/cobalt efflux protein [Magnetovibrio sp.]|nr:magnesium/cobalt efflux protein [Magnetovibrio sp.]
MNDQSPSQPSADAEDNDDSSRPGSLSGWLRGLFRHNNVENPARDVLAELIEQRDEQMDTEAPIDGDQRALLSNVLDLQDRTIHDIMVPRADIVAIESGADLSEVIELMTKGGHSRLPLYRNTLDDALGMVHIRDVLAWRGKDDAFSLSKIQRKVLFVSPSMLVLELLLEMRVKRCHMALVVDEFGGVDGMVTIEDLVEEIVGEIEDEHDRSDEADLTQRPDGAIDANARASLESLEQMLGSFVTEEEREEISTLGGLVFLLAGRVPTRGELISHPSGLEFEVLEAAPRRIKRLRVRGRNPTPLP